MHGNPDGGTKWNWVCDHLLLCACRCTCTTTCIRMRGRLRPHVRMCVHIYMCARALYFPREQVHRPTSTTEENYWFSFTHGECPVFHEGCEKSTPVAWHGPLALYSCEKTTAPGQWAFCVIQKLWVPKRNVWTGRKIKISSEFLQFLSIFFSFFFSSQDFPRFYYIFHFLFYYPYFTYFLFILFVYVTFSEKVFVSVTRRFITHIVHISMSTSLKENKSILINTRSRFLWIVFYILTNCK